MFCPSFRLLRKHIILDIVGGSNHCAHEMQHDSSGEQNGGNVIPYCIRVETCKNNKQWPIN